MVYGNRGSAEADRINRTDGILEFSGIVTTDCIAGTVEWLELDGNNRLIWNDGTNGTDWAETIDGADRTYRTLGKLIITLDWRKLLNW